MLTVRPFGTTAAGAPVTAYTITNAHGVSLTVLDYGATLQSVVLPHRGEPVDVVLGYDTIEEYEQNDGYLGATIGRYAGRIPDAILPLSDKRYLLCKNDGENHLHGGAIGFDRRMFDADANADSVTFSRLSPGGEENYPGALAFSVTYTLGDDDALSILFRGAADTDACWNPTNHAYWNLNGHDAGDARAHVLTLPADRYVPVDGALIPVAPDADVSGTRYDFRVPRRIGGEYDTCFLLCGGPIMLAGESGIRMELTTDCEAVQFYTAGFLSDRAGKGGARYAPYGAVCLETASRQLVRGGTLPESAMLNANEPKTRTTRIRFFCEE